MNQRKRVYNTWYGITRRDRYVDPEWRDSFDQFLEEVGFPPTAENVLCMRDPDAGFYPGNVYWGTRKDLQQYVKHARRVIHNGQVMSMSEAARRIGIHRVSLRERLDKEDSGKVAIPFKSYSKKARNEN